LYYHESGAEILAPDYHRSGVVASDPWPASSRRDATPRPARARLRIDVTHIGRVRGSYSPQSSRCPTVQCRSTHLLGLQRCELKDTGMRPQALSGHGPRTAVEVPAPRGDLSHRQPSRNQARLRSHLGQEESPAFLDVARTAMALTTLAILYRR
jgi:hypothetical protein